MANNINSENLYHSNHLLSSLHPGYEDYDFGGQTHKVEIKPIQEGKFSKRHELKNREVIHDPYRSRVELNKHPKNYYNPNDYIQISPKEIEEQAKANLELMKQSEDKWREENQKANNWKPTL